MHRSAAQIRREFIEYFTQKAGHAFVPSSPVVPHDDPTLLFTNAGMNQFKDLFLGQGSRPYTRAVNTQKCIRAGGKHNDLEDVGKDTYHHTFFEMLGNWSFGDYFKAEAIKWAWDLLTEVWKLDKRRLHVTVFEGDRSENLEPDDEAAGLWRTMTDIDHSHIHYGSKKDNFWEMGDTGPCGPCSEIHYDGTPEGDGGHLVNAGDPRVIEIWNLVFIQFNRGANGRLAPLPAKHVDTGMGFERITRVIQGKSSNYDTDIWSPIFLAIEQLTGARAYRGKLEDHIDIAYRVIADHIRCLTMAITDGARPSNEGRGYVLRRILRRAVRHAHQTLGVKGPLLYRLVPSVIDSLGEAFPELLTNPAHVSGVIREEEEAFLKTLDRGMVEWWYAANAAFDQRILDDTNDPQTKVRYFPSSSASLTKQGYKDLQRGLMPFHASTNKVLRKDSSDGPVVFEGTSEELITRENVSRFCSQPPMISGNSAFELHQTYGFPIDLTRVMAEEHGMTVDEEGFNELMEVARAASRKASDGGTEFTLSPEAIARLILMKVDPTQDNGKYLGHPITATIKAIFNPSGFYEHVEPHGDDLVAIITNRTNFYAEAGGQIGDTGRIVDLDGGRSEFAVHDAKAFGGYVLHIGRLTRGNLRVGESVNMMIQSDRRTLIRGNHTATHLLNHALREVLGEEVHQKGSLVADARLRFDFSQAHALKPEQIERVENLVNDAIRADLQVDAEVVPLEHAKRIHGLRAVFGERYPDPVRVVSIGAPVRDLLADPANSKWRQASVEFCGGTHLSRTGEALHFALLSEQALAAGVRRIVALTGPAARAADHAGRDLEHRALNAMNLADDLLPTEFDEIVRLADELTISAATKHRVMEQIEQVRSRVKAIRKFAQSAARDTVVDQARALAENAEGRIIVDQVQGADKDTLLAAMDVVRAKRPEAATMLLSANEVESKVFIVAAVPPAYIAQGLKAGEWVKHAALACGGSGGGRPDMAQAGGKDPTKMLEAMAAATNFAEAKLGAE